MTNPDEELRKILTHNHYDECICEKCKEVTAVIKEIKAWHAKERVRWAIEVVGEIDDDAYGMIDKDNLISKLKEANDEK